MATVRFSVPNEEQAELMREMGINPEGYAMMTDDESSMSARHLKTRNDIIISKNRRVVKNDSQ